MYAKINQTCNFIILNSFESSDAFPSPSPPPSNISTPSKAASTAGGTEAEGSSAVLRSLCGCVVSQGRFLHYDSL